MTSRAPNQASAGNGTHISASESVAEVQSDEDISAPRWASSCGVQLKNSAPPSPAVFPAIAITGPNILRGRRHFPWDETQSPVPPLVPSAGSQANPHTQSAHRTRMRGERRHCIPSTRSMASQPRWNSETNQAVRSLEHSREIQFEDRLHTPASPILCSLEPEDDLRQQ